MMNDINVYSGLHFTDGTAGEILDMKVTKAQAQANRAHIVETASTLFRERGYDGVGIADLMAARDSPMAASTSTSRPRPT